MNKINENSFFIARPSLTTLKEGLKRLNIHWKQVFNAGFVLF